MGELRAEWRDEGSARPWEGACDLNGRSVAVTRPAEGSVRDGDNAPSRGEGVLPARAAAKGPVDLSRRDRAKPRRALTVSKDASIPRLLRMELQEKGSARPWVGACNFYGCRAAVILPARRSLRDGYNAPSRGEGRARPGLRPGDRARTMLQLTPDHITSPTP
jgi:hypothetical protein